MLKRNSIIKFVFLALIAVLGILLCVCPISLPNSTKTYNGFLYSIEKGLELGGGAYAEYECTLPAGSPDKIEDVIDASLYKVRTAFGVEKYTELSVSRRGENKIRVEAAKAKDTDYAFWYFEDGKQFSMTYEAASDSVSPKVIVKSTDIDNVKADYSYDTSAYGLKVTFTNEGLTNLEKLKTDAKKTADKKIYVYLGEVNSSNLLNEYSVSDVDNNMFLTAKSGGTYSTTNYSDVRELAYSITSAATGVNLTLISVGNISPKLGLNVQLILEICLLIIIVASFVLFVVRYRELGLLGALSMIFFAVLDLFLLQSIPLITLNVAGVVAIALGYMIAFVSHMILFEKMREEYAMGKKLHLSCKGGFKKALWPILDSHFILAIICVFMWIFLPGSLKGFAIIMLVALLLSVFTTLALMRYFVATYLRINSTKAKRLGFRREEGVKEISEEVSEENEDEVANSVVGGGNNE